MTISWTRSSPHREWTASTAGLGGSAGHPLIRLAIMGLLLNGQYRNRACASVYLATAPDCPSVLVAGLGDWRHKGKREVEK